MRCIQRTRGRCEIPQITVSIPGGSLPNLRPALLQYFFLKEHLCQLWSRSRLALPPLERNPS